MFYDERIELERGRISRNCIALCVLLSLISGILQGFQILSYSKLTHTPQPALWIYISMEIVIVLAGLMILTIGILRCHGSDERSFSARNLFYNKAMFIFLILVGVSLAVFFPISLVVRRPSNFASEGFGGILELLLFAVGIYAIYNFKNRDIYFNYSIMESPHYYRNVWKNIGKAWLYILCGFGISVATLGSLWVFNFQRFQEDASAIAVIYAWYALLFAVCTLLYLLFSFLERESYKSEQGLSKASGISLLTTVCIYCVYAAGLLWLNNQGIDQAFSLRLLKYVQMLFPYIQFALMVFLIYFSYEYARRYGRSGIGNGCLCILLGLLGSKCADKLLQQLQYFFLFESTVQYDLIVFFSSARQICNDLAIFSYVTGFCMIILTLVKNEMLPKAHFAMYGIFAICIGIDLFLRLQAEYMVRTVFLACVYAAVLIYLCFVVFHVIQKSKFKEVPYE